MQIHSVGIDLGKTTFHLVALGAAGKVLVRRKFTQRQLLTYTANMQASLIGLEACSGAHFLGRVLGKQGHDVRLIAAQFVKPFVKSNKSDFVDAEAIAEAVQRKNMRFVPIKTDDQLDLQAIHRVRDRSSIGAWMDALDARAPKNVVVVATANKLARIAWAVLSSGENYRPMAKRLAA